MIRAVRPALVVLVILSAAGAGSLVGRAQSASAGSPDVLTALLAEVRGLRMAIEQMASAGPRVQLALGRLQIQEQRVGDLVRRLDEARKGVSQMQKQIDGEAQESKMVEEALAQVTDQNHRRAMEESLRHLKANRQHLQAEMQRFQTEEATAAQDLANEQGRWSQFNQQLDEIERSLGRRQP